MLIIDTQKQDKFSILSEAKKDGDVTKVRVRFTQADEKNRNGRTYPLALWNREVNRIQDDIDAGGVLGMSGHPKDAVTDAGDVSHIVSKLWMDGKTGFAELKILDTTKGKNLKTVMKAGGRLAVSTRGFGTMDSDTGVVNDDYKLDNLDIVVNPSFRGGFFTQDSVFEGLDLSKKNVLGKSSKSGHSGDGHMENKDKKWVNILKMMFEEDLKDGSFEGSLKTYIDENERIVKSVLAVEDGKYADLETALKEMFGEEAVQEIVDLKKSKAIPAKPVTSGDVRETARIARVPASELAEAINKENAKPVAMPDRQALYRQVWVSFGQSATPKLVNEAVERIVKANIRTEKPAPKTLTESEKLVEAKKKKRQKRISIKQGMYTDGFLAGFTKPQIDDAILKRMAQLDEQELED